MQVRVLLVLVFYQMYKRNQNALIASIPAAIIKCGFLWISIPMVLKIIPYILPNQVLMLTTMFSWPQGITAVCGGLITVLVLPLIKGIHEK